MNLQMFVDYDHCEKGRCVNCTKEQQAKCVKEVNQIHKKEVEDNDSC